MKRSFIVLYLLLLILSAAFSESAAQETGTLRGFVSDSTNGEVLAFCNVFIEGTKLGATTNVYGFFNIPSVPADKKYTLLVSYVGYKTEKLEVVILPNKKTEINIRLKPISIVIEDIVKVGEQIKKTNETDLGLTKLTMKELELIPKGVESDLFRSLQTLPGVKSTSDISGRFYVRGGSGDQNLVLINGATIYNPFHAMGIFSIIDPEIINSVQFYKGVFPVEYEGRLSSVISIKTKDGNRNRFSGTAQASFLTGKAMVEGPLPGGSFLLAGRKSYFGDVMKDFLNNKQAPFDFYDYSVKINYANPELLKNSKFVVHALASHDDIRYNDPLREDFSFSNNIFGIDYYQVYEAPLYSIISFSSSQYRAEVIPNLSNARLKKNFVKEFSGNVYFTYLFDSKDELGIGMQIKSFKPDFEFDNILGNRVIYNDIGGNFDLYTKYSLLRFSDFGMEGGFRLSPANYTVKPAPLILPRLNITYRMLDDVTLKAGWGIYKQEVMAFADENEVISVFEPYLIIPEYLSPSSSIHYMAGIDWDVTENLLLSVEGYYKTLRDLTDINPDKLTVFDNDLLNTDGEAYGVELYSKYQDRSIFASVAYTLSWAFKGLGRERYFPRYDSRHSVTLMMAVDLGAGWNTSAIWTLSSGQPFTQSVGFYDKLAIRDLWSQWLVLGEMNPFALLGNRNTARLPFYHRLDLNLSKKFAFFFTNLTFEINVINVYDRKNIFYFDRKTGDRINMLPFLPTASVKIEI